MLYSASLPVTNCLLPLPFNGLMVCISSKRNFISIILITFQNKKSIIYIYMSHFSYTCKTEGKNGISRLISALCVNCLISIPEYSRIIDYSIIWMCIWCGLLQKLHKIKKSELLNSKVSSKL